jgi:ABC-type Fe3+-hydroxamate transport system substrate-binding protein
VRVVDDLGRSVELAAPPRRIVSLVPSLTETLFAIGAGPQVLAVTRYCEEPAAEVVRLPKVGGTKNPEVDAIRALTPDLVIMNAEENRREDFAALSAAGLTVFVTEPKTVADGIAVIASLGELTGRPEGGAMAAVQQTRVRAVVEQVGARVPVRYFCPIWRKPWMAFNADTYAHDLLRTAGGMNVCAADPTRYPVVTLEAIALAVPEVVLLPDEPYRFTEKDRSALTPLAMTPALRHARVHFVDGKALSWYGPRIADGVAHFAAIFFPVRPVARSTAAHDD